MKFTTRITPAQMAQALAVLVTLVGVATWSFAGSSTGRCDGE